MDIMKQPYRNVDFSRVPKCTKSQYATLGLFGDIPVSHFTDIPSIDITLHNIHDSWAIY